MIKPLAKLSTDDNTDDDNTRRTIHDCTVFDIYAKWAN